ncbi:MAG TPA: hypothetical protein VMY88_02975 [Acidimicrobiales bacterium]|nr:hypothetical protein [Acidimicrobiales bacterium]
MDHPAGPPSAAGEGGGESWWLLQAPGYVPVGGGPTPEEISNTTGSLWMIEYSDTHQTVRLVADRAGGLFSQLSAASPEIGKVTVDGVEATLRQHPGRPEEGIAPSVGAEWTDNGVFVSFGGAGLSEEGLRALLAQVHRVTSAEWEKAAAAIPPPPPEAAPPGPPESVVP